MSTNNSPNEENKSTVADVVYDDNRTCSLCKQTFPRSSFSLNQWSKNEAANAKAASTQREEKRISEMLVPVAMMMEEVVFAPVLYAN